MGFYVSIDGIAEDKLNLLGFQILARSNEFLLVGCYNGDEHIVDSTNGQYLYVEDANDAMELAAQSSSKKMVTVP